MATETTPAPAPAKANKTEPEIKIDLRQPGVAAVWAWLWPGAGHIYQGRYAKGILYMVCILGTYFFGLTMGNSHVVYASFDYSKGDLRWHYILQAGVGLPAAPAMVQYIRVRNGKSPLFGNLETFDKDDKFVERSGFMAPPRVVGSDKEDQLSDWHKQDAMMFELGTLYTVVAGLLNILVIYDAFAGPVIAHPEDEKEKDKDKRKPPDEKK